MSTPLEAAAKWCNIGVEIGELFIEKFVRVAVGCPQCGGTDTVECELIWNSGHDCGGEKHCPAEHVELSILGEIVYADPDLCFHYCVSGFTPERCGSGSPLSEWAAVHSSCGWQPRWNALFPQGDNDGN